jgi:Domain of unknown function (DUF4124)
MKRSRIVVVTVMAVLTGITLGPTASRGEGFHGGPVGGRAIAGAHHVGSRHIGGQRFGPHSFAPAPFDRHPFAFHPFGSHRFFHRGFASFGLGGVVFLAPPFLYDAPYAAAPTYDEQPAYYSPPGSYEAPVVYSPPPINTVSAAPAPPPAPSVVEFSSGRYELRGDGMTTPYAWVWIPNPPSSPPPSAAEAPPSRESPPRRSQLYRWTDEQGVVHLTDRWDAVPEQYRTPAKQARPS